MNFEGRSEPVNGALVKLPQVQLVLGGTRLRADVISARKKERKEERKKKQDRHRPWASTRHPVPKALVFTFALVIASSVTLRPLLLLFVLRKRIPL